MSEKKLYLSSNFLTLIGGKENWCVSDEKFILKPVNKIKNMYSITFKIKLPKVEEFCCEYKITEGEWEKSYGNFSFGVDKENIVTVYYNDMAKLAFAVVN